MTNDATAGERCTIRPVILCGGAGTRLWPASRDTMPKQFARLLGPRSTFQQTLLRLAGAGFARPLVVTNQAHVDLVHSQFVEIDSSADILAEPARRDSGPAIVAACVKLLDGDADSLALVVAADHVMAHPEAFAAAVRTGASAAMQGRIVTFGVTPTHADTGYGYIEAGGPIQTGVREVRAFAEKPERALAEEYVRRGMLWNSGSFLFGAKVLLDEYRHVDEATIVAVEQAYLERKIGARGELLGPAYARAEARSLDYAVMEKTRRAAVVPVSCGWSDVGSWDALWQLGDKNDQDNVISGDVETIDSTGCLIASDGPLTTAIGMHDLVVVAADGAILVAQRGRAGEVKGLVEKIRRRGSVQADAHSRVHRPWGNYRVTDAGQGFQVKRIVVNPGGRLSLQKHRFRAEHWVVVSGKAWVTVGQDVRVLGPNEHIDIPLGAIHRLENFGSETVELVEVQCGSYLGEDDIVRLEDIYERAAAAIPAADSPPLANARIDGPALPVHSPSSTLLQAKAGP